MKKTLIIALVLLISCNNTTSQKEIKDTVYIDKKMTSRKLRVSNFEERQDTNRTNHNLSCDTKDYLTGKISFSTDSRFVKLDSKYCVGRNIYVRKEVAEAYTKMREAALKDGIELFVLSGGRTFQQQKNIWEHKWELYKNLKPKERTLKILTFSSMPMTSRHHWGTDIDLNSLDNNYFSDGKGLKVYKWLVKNAPNYGFCQVYTDKSNGRIGYEMEKWHWSYMPISSLLLEEYNQKINITDFSGFSGFEMAKEVNIITNYVNGINNQCE